MAFCGWRGLCRELWEGGKRVFEDDEPWKNTLKGLLRTLNIERRREEGLNDE
jgi:hypothetical protein